MNIRQVEDHSQSAQKQDQAVRIAEGATILALVHLFQLLLPALQAIQGEQDLTPLHEVLVLLWPVALRLLWLTYGSSLRPQFNPLAYLIQHSTLLNNILEDFYKATFLYKAMILLAISSLVSFNSSIRSLPLVRCCNSITALIRCPISSG
jgi:hypothetical protein